MSHDWIRHQPFADAACLTLVECDDIEKVAHAFGAEPGHKMSILVDWAELGHEHKLLLRHLGDWTLAIEVDGFQGSRPEVLRRTSLVGKTVSAYWTVDLDTRLSYAEDGEVLLNDDVFDEDDDDDVAYMLSEIERRTGQRPDPEWFADGLVEVSLVPWQQDVHSSINLDYESFAYDDPPLAYALSIATSSQLDAVMAQVATAVGIDPGGDLEGQLRYAPHDQRAALTALLAVREGSPLAAVRAGLQVNRYLRHELMPVLGNPTLPSGSAGLIGDREHLWLNYHWLRRAGAVTWVHTDDVAAVVRALGKESGRDIVRMAAPPVTAVRAHGDWTMVLDAGLVSHRYETLQGFDRVEVRWEVRRQALLVETSGGERRLWLDRHNDFAQPGAFPAPAVLTQAVGLTGVAFTPESLDEEHIIVERTSNSGNSFGAQRRLVRPSDIRADRL